MKFYSELTGRLAKAQFREQWEEVRDFDKCIETRSHEDKTKKVDGVRITHHTLYGIAAKYDPAGLDKEYALEKAKLWASKMEALQEEFPRGSDGVLFVKQKKYDDESSRAPGGA